MGVKDELLGEEIAAWVIPDREVPNPEEMLAELREMCEGKIAHYKVPRYIYLCEAFPLTVTGKVRKNVIRDVTNKLLDEKSPEVLAFSASKNKL